MTSRTQDTRARSYGALLRRFDLCGHGSLPLSAWPYQIAYEWGALFKALVLYRSC